jgi:hypothetical protein
MMVAGLAALLLAAGCASGPAQDQRRVLAMDLADVLRTEALKIQDEGERDKIASGLVRIREVLGEAPVPKNDVPAILPQPEGGVGYVPPWARMFLPKAITIGFFTQTKIFDSGQPGIEVRVQPIDQFGDPTKAVGSYRIEVFQYLLRTTDPKGPRLGHWYVTVLDGDSNRKYYDPIDRSYAFPLLWEGGGAKGVQFIVQVTYYPPGGFEEKIIAQRRIRIGE